MASWMVHLRVADKLLNCFRFLHPTEFIMGNIAPDSGVPNADWSVFTPSKRISHFKTDKRKADPEEFAKKYFLPQMQEMYNAKQYSFYLGYLVHLLTDSEWSEHIAQPSKIRFAKEFTADPDHFWEHIKDDWYDLDFRFLQDHPDFRGFQIYSGAEGFVNSYMEEFSIDAFDNRRQYITDFYLQEKENLDRTYPYLTQQEMDAFVDNCWQKILLTLKNQYGLSCCL